MPGQATCADDVHRAVRIGKRCACITFTEDGQLYLKYPSLDKVAIKSSNIHYVVKGASMAALVFRTPVQVGSPPTKPVMSVVVTNGCDSQIMWSDVLSRLTAFPNPLDTAKATFLTTVCGRHSVHILSNNTAVLWHANTTCTVATRIHTVFMQRTKGGMATYDVHLLCESCEQPVTIEMLPHSSLDTWAQLFRAGQIYDFGPDPVKATLLSAMYQECGRSWAAVMSEVRGVDGAASADGSGSGSDSDSNWDPWSTSSDDEMSEENLSSVESSTSSSSCED